MWYTSYHIEWNHFIATIEISWNNLLLMYNNLPGLFRRAWDGKQQLEKRLAIPESTKNLRSRRSCRWQYWQGQLIQRFASALGGGGSTEVSEPFWIWKTVDWFKFTKKSHHLFFIFNSSRANTILLCSNFLLWQNFRGFNFHGWRGRTKIFYLWNIIPFHTFADDALRWS